MRQLGVLLCLLLAPGLGACSRDPELFSDQNARAHVGMLAGTIGSRPVGTPENARAREYIIDQLRLFGFDVRVQEADARRPELGRTARVANIIGVRRGARDEAVGLVSHYDSSPDAPGAADDAFGVAVSLEAARVLAARDRHWSLMILVTDGEEVGLMGAAALMSDREVTRRLHAYINLEAVGSGSPVMLFETGPGNDWLVTPWARQAPHPRGASFGPEIYRHLPNETDFSIFRRHEIPGLNFAAVGDSYAYHTARDTPERLSVRALRQAGENAVGMLTALDRIDITQRNPRTPTYFDLNGTAGLSYGPEVGWIAAAVALLAGIIGWVRVTGVALRTAGIGGWLLTGVWTLIGAAIVLGSMIAATWALRAAREVYHPWYARPDRYFFLLIVLAAAIGWSVARVGHWLPARLHGVRHPLMTWSMALPAWILLACAALWLAPGAAYLWVLPLLAAGLPLAAVRVTSSTAVRVVSVIVLAVVATLWLRNTVDLLRFTVAIFGRLPLITPLFVYPALLAAVGLMIVPPLVGAVATPRPLVRPKLMTAVLLLGIAIASGLAYAAPAYTDEQPLRRHVRALQHATQPGAVWEVASVEPGLDLEPTAPSGWTLASEPPPPPLSPWPFPFVFRADGPSLGPPPAIVSPLALQPVETGVELSLTVVPHVPGLVVSFMLPPGVTPARSSFPGLQRRGRWSAMYIAPPAEGVVFRASFNEVDAELLAQTRVVLVAARFPGGLGWQRLPEWLPQERAVWSGSAIWDLPPAPQPAIAPVPPLR